MNQEESLETFQKGLIIYTRLIIWPLNVKKIVAVRKKAWKFSLFNPDICDTIPVSTLATSANEPAGS